MITVEFFITVLTIALIIAAACIAVIQWATGNRYRSTLWAWVCGYWVLQLIRELLMLIYKGV